MKWNFAELIADNGVVSATKFMAFGAFLVSSGGVIASIVHDKMTAEMLTIYASVFVLGRLGNQLIGTTAATQVKREQIRRGRRDDDPEDEYAGSDRRATDDERPPGQAKRSVLR